MTHHTNISDIFNHIVSSISFTMPGESSPRVIPFYFGYWPEISNGLRLQGIDKSKDGLKYPCVIMNSSIIERKGTDFRYLAEIDCKFVIVYETQPNYSTTDRVTNIYTPILYPLYDAFLEAIRTSHYCDVNQKGQLGQIRHDKQDLFYLGSEKVNQNQLSDIVDAIEITFKGLKLRKFTY